VHDLITKTPPRPITRPERTTSHVEEIVTRAALKPLDSLPFGFKPDAPSLTLWEKIRLLPYVFQIFLGVVMQDPKTTISGVIKAAFMLATVFGISLGNVTEALVTGVVWGIVEIYQSFNTADTKSEG